MALTPKMILLLVVGTLSACVSGNDAMVRSADEADAVEDTQIFFSAHPEYMASGSKEALLFSIFKDILSRPENRRKPMIQLLKDSHEQLQILEKFENNKSFS